MVIRHILSLDQQIHVAGIPIAGVDQTGRVSPDDLQKQAQPIIDAFDDSDEAHRAREQQAIQTSAKADLAADVTLQAVLDVVVSRLNDIHAALKLQPITVESVLADAATAIDAAVP